MRLVAVADLHGRAARLDRLADTVARLRPDAVVVAGDVTAYLHPDPVIARLGRLPVPVLVVRGNSDLPVVGRLLDHYAATTHLHLRAVTVGGVRVVGVSGTLPVPFATRLGLREAATLRGLEPLVDPGTVLVAHPPPRGTLDEAFGRFHAGSAALRDLVLAREPAVLLCGHIHERRGVATLGRTLVVNCSVGRGGAGVLLTVDAAGARAELL
jgi:hypothetical protein